MHKTMAVLSFIAATSTATSAQAVPAAFHVELRGLEAESPAPEKPVDHSRVSLVSPLRAKKPRPAKPRPVMALLVQAGLAGKTKNEDVEVRFVGMRFEPSHVTLTEGVQLRLLNDSPVAMELMPRGKNGKALPVAVGQSIRFAPGKSQVYRYGTRRWASAVLRVDVAPKGRLIPLRAFGGGHTVELGDLKEGPAHLKLQIGERWEGIPEFILRQNNVLKMVIAYEPEGKGGARKLRVVERREVPVELSEADETERRRKPEKRRRSRRRRRRGR